MEQTTLSVRSKNNIKNIPYPHLPNLWVLQGLQRKRFLVRIFMIPCLVKYVLSDLPLSMEGEVSGALCCMHADGASERLLSSSGLTDFFWLAAISSDYIRLKRALAGHHCRLPPLTVCVAHKTFLSLTGIRSRQFSAAAARRTWQPVLKKASGCVCLTCLRSRCSMVGRNVATAMWRRERSVTVENRRWECYRSC